MAPCILQLVLGCWNTGATQESAVGLSKPLGRLLAHRRKMWVLGSALLSASSDRCSQQPQLQHTLAECVPLAPAVPQAGHDSRLPGDVRNVTVTHRGELWGYGRGSLSAVLSGGHLTTPAQPPNACPGRGRWWRGATGAAGPLASRARPPGLALLPARKPQAATAAAPQALPALPRGCHPVPPCLSAATPLCPHSAGTAWHGEGPHCPFWAGWGTRTAAAARFGERGMLRW